MATATAVTTATARRAVPTVVLFAAAPILSAGPAHAARAATAACPSISSGSSAGRLNRTALDAR